MNNEKANTGYLLLFRGTRWDKGLDPEVTERVTGQFMAWFERLSREGTVRSGHPLVEAGKLVSGKNGRSVADGPYAESKEAVGGYFLLNVADMNEAVAIARQCPALEYGLEVEVRQIAAECPSLERANQLLEPAAA